jgi:hypothetical protein
MEALRNRGGLFVLEGILYAGPLGVRAGGGCGLQEDIEIVRVDGTMQGFLALDLAGINQLNE